MELQLLELSIPRVFRSQEELKLMEFQLLEWSIPRVFPS
jgi:hypothetical protein